MSEVQPIRGVNLGGWLIAERWLTPSLFAGTDALDEFTFMQTPGAAAKIEDHRRTFITGEDFRWLAEHGVDLVRIPVGYWLFDGDPPFTPVIDHLDWAVRTAASVGIKVLIVLHGAPGSQNGRDHSGRIGAVGWHRHSIHRLQTTEVLTRIARHYRSRDLWGIELLNEPRYGLIQFKLRAFYRRVNAQLAGLLDPGTAIVFSDAFTPRLLSGALRPRSAVPVIMDCHLYQTFKPWDRRRSIAGHLKLAQSRAMLIKKLSRRQPVLVGEWSGVLPAEAIGDLAPDVKRALLADFLRVQQEAYAGAIGWCYWTYKTEVDDDWNFRYLVEEGLISLARD